MYEIKLTKIIPTFGTKIKAIANTPMISVSKLRLSELIVFLNDTKIVEREILPLSRHRVLSLIVNPRSSNQDIIVYLAHYNNEPIGYRTVLPDTININGLVSKVAWLSGSWVHPNYRRKGVALLLLKEVIKDWGNNLLSNNFAPNAKQLYQKTDFFNSLYTAHGMRYYLRKTYLKGYNSCFHNSTFDLIKERAINFFNFSTLLRKGLKMPKYVELEYFTRPDNELVKMFNKANSTTLTRRTEEEWNWMLRFPWLQAAPLGDRISPKYFFASAPPVFNQYIVKVFFHDEIIGMLHIQHSFTRLTVPYSYFDPQYSLIMAKIVLLHAQKLKATFIATYNSNLINGLNGLRRYFLYTKKRTREFLASKSIVNNIGSTKFTFNDGDGDCGFI